jgi:hypothetical protein
MKYLPEKLFDPQTKVVRAAGTQQKTGLISVAPTVMMGR